jgi:hypothetical protein
MTEHMIFIWGSYSRGQTLHEMAMCTRCNAERPIEFRRIWRTAHFFFVPLFSYSQAVLSQCRHCGREGVAYFPRPLAPLPFFDRLGFLVPVGAIAASFLMLVVSVVTATPQARASDGPDGPNATAKATASGGELRRSIEREMTGRVAQQSLEEKAVAKSVTTAIEDAYRGVGTVRVAVRVRPAGDGSAHKRAIVLVQLTNLRHADDKVRDHLLEDIRTALEEVLGPDDEAVVGVKGTILYGIMGAGPVGAPWKKTKIDTNVSDDLDAALSDP